MIREGAITQGDFFKLLKPGEIFESSAKQRLLYQVSFEYTSAILKRVRDYFTGIVKSEQQYISVFQTIFKKLDISLDELFNLIDRLDGAPVTLNILKSFLHRHNLWISKEAAYLLLKRIGTDRRGEVPASNFKFLFAK